MPIFNHLLGIVPRPAGIRHEHGQELPDENHSCQEPSKSIGSQKETGEDRGKNRQQSWTNELFLRRYRADINNPSIVGPFCAGPDFSIAELCPAFFYNEGGSPANRP